MWNSMKMTDKLYAFDSYLSAVGMSSNTIRAYLGAVVDFSASVGGELTKDSIQKYVANLRSRGLSPSTINLRLVGLRKYAEWAEIPLDTRAIKKVKAPPNPPRVATAEDIDAIVSTTKKVSHKAAILLMADAGLRRSEVVGLTTDSVDLEHRTLMVLGKGGKTRAIPVLTKRLEQALQAIMKNVGSGRLFPFSGSNLYEALHSACRRAGIGEINPHSLRHSFASRCASSSGGSVKAIQVALGHSSLVTTDRYLQSLNSAEFIRSGLSGFAPD